MIRAFLSGSLALALTVVLFVGGINGLFPVITEVHDFLNDASTNFAQVFPWMGMDSVGLLLFISLAKTMAAFVYFSDIFGLTDNCMNAFVTLYTLCIVSGAAWFNFVQRQEENLAISVVLIAMVLFRQLLRRPKA